MDETTINQHAKSALAKAWSLAERHELAEAIRSVEKAIQLRPNWSECWVIKGHFLRESMDFDAAEVALRKALELNVSDHCAWTELGLVFRDSELFEKAAFCFRQSVQITPDYNVYTLLANMELTFDLESALADAEKALDLRPGWDEALHIRDAAIRQLKNSCFD